MKNTIYESNKIDESSISLSHQSQSKQMFNLTNSTFGKGYGEYYIKRSTHKIEDEESVVGSDTLSN